MSDHLTEQFVLANCIESMDEIAKEIKTIANNQDKLLSDLDILATEVKGLAYHLNNIQKGFYNKDG